MLQLAGPPNAEAILLDFFGGSATTAHAVLQQNAIDEGNRSFVIVQIPESLPKPESEMSSILEMGMKQDRGLTMRL